MRLIIALLLSIALPANAGILGSLASSSWPTKETTRYKLDAYGFDVRVYEWTPEDNKNVRCILAAGNNNSTGVACYEVSND